METITEVVLELDVVAEPVEIDADEDELDAELEFEPVEAVDVWYVVVAASCSTARFVAVLEPDNQASRPEFALLDADVFRTHC